VHKVVSWSSFRVTLSKYMSGLGVSRAPLVNTVAIIVVATEIGAVAVCAWPGSGGVAASIIGGVLLAYAGAMFVNLMRGNVLLDCGCSWGPARQPIGYGLVARNIGLALLALVLAVPVAARPLEPVDILSAVMAAVTGACLYAALNGLLSDSRSVMREAQ
jgi:Methylamine utilisation protein MauE